MPARSEILLRLNFLWQGRLESQLNLWERKKPSRETVFSVFKTEVQDMPSPFKAAKLTKEPELQTPPFDTPEEAEDEREWEAMVATFSPDEFALLDDWINELIQEGGTKPLDFTDR